MELLQYAGLLLVFVCINAEPSTSKIQHKKEVDHLKYKNDFTDLIDDDIKRLSKAATDLADHNSEGNDDEKENIVVNTDEKGEDTDDKLVEHLSDLLEDDENMDDHVTNGDDDEDENDDHDDLNIDDNNDDKDVDDGFDDNDDDVNDDNENTNYHTEGYIADYDAIVDRNDANGNNDVYHNENNIKNNMKQYTEETDDTDSKSPAEYSENDGENKVKLYTHYSDSSQPEKSVDNEIIPYDESKVHIHLKEDKHFRADKIQENSPIWGRRGGVRFGGGRFRYGIRRFRYGGRRFRYGGKKFRYGGRRFRNIGRRFRRGSRIFRRNKIRRNHRRNRRSGFIRRQRFRLRKNTRRNWQRLKRYGRFHIRRRTVPGSRYRSRSNRISRRIKSRIQGFRFRRSFIRRFGSKLQKIGIKSGFLKNWRKLKSQFGKFGKKLFKTRPISKLKGYLKNMYKRVRKNLKIKKFLKSLKTRLRSLKVLSKEIVTSTVKKLLKKNKLKLKTSDGKSHSDNKIDWGKLVGGILKAITNGDGGSNPSEGSQPPDSSGPTGGGNPPDGPRPPEGGPPTAKSKELTVDSIIQTMRQKRNSSSNTTTIEGTTLLGLELVENAFENSVIVDTIQHFVSGRFDVFVGLLPDNRIVTLKTKGNTYPMLLVKGPLKSYKIQIIG